MEKKVVITGLGAPITPIGNDVRRILEKHKRRKMWNRQNYKI